MRQELEAIRSSEWKPRVLVVGGLVGLLLGVTAAYLVIQNQTDDRPPQYTAGDGVKMGVMVLGLLRGIASM
ncbi:MAG: hypothetical protein ACKOC5_14420 [Chloroflexota bacterium]